jgi:anti-sigma factor RsiW
MSAMEKDKEKLRSRLSAYLDGELSSGEAEKMAAAIQADEALRAELRGLQATRDLLRKLPKESAPAGLLDGIMEQLERKRLLSAPAEAAPKPLQIGRAHV